MSADKKQDKKNLAHARVESIEELEDLRLWWQKHGNGVSLILTVVLLSVIAYNLYNRHVESKKDAASQAYFAATSVEELDDLVATHRKSSEAPLALLQIGGMYYQQQRYEPAMDAYESFLRDYPKHPLVPVALLGVAHVKEAEGKFAEAGKGFGEFVEANPSHYMLPMALLGQARSAALADRRDEARAILDRMMADYAGTAWAGLADDLSAALPRLEHVSLDAADQFADALRTLQTQGLTPELEGDGAATEATETVEAVAEDSAEADEPETEEASAADADAPAAVAAEAATEAAEEAAE